MNAPAPAAARPALAAWQRDMVDHALHGDPASATRLLAALGRGPVPGDEALEIHATTVHHALYSALRQRVPTVEALVGEDFLRELTREFARQYPPRQPQLARWGQALPAFIADHPGCQGLPYLADAAAFDLALDEVALSEAGRWGETLSLVEGLALQVLDSLQLFSSRFPVDQLRDAVMAAQAGDDTALQAVSLVPGDHHYALWCAADAQVRCCVVSKGLAAFLAALTPGDDGRLLVAASVDAPGAPAHDAPSLEPALQAALEVTGTQEADAAELFTTLLQEMTGLGAVRLLPG